MTEPTKSQVRRLYAYRSSDETAPILCKACSGVISMGSPCPSLERGKPAQGHDMPHVHWGTQDCKHHEPLANAWEAKLEEWLSRAEKMMEQQEQGTARYWKYQGMVDVLWKILEEGEDE